MVACIPVYAESVAVMTSDGILQNRGFDTYSVTRQKIHHLGVCVSEQHNAHLIVRASTWVGFALGLLMRSLRYMYGHKQAYTNVHSAVTVVWGSLRLNPTMEYMENIAILMFSEIIKSLTIMSSGITLIGA